MCEIKYKKMEKENIPWKNDWECPNCLQCNYGSDNYCTNCGTKNPNKKIHKRKYCKRCGRIIKHKKND